MRNRWVVYLLLAVFLLTLTAGFIYNLPPVHERLAWRVASLQTKIRYAISPPAQVVFVPEGAAVTGTSDTAAPDNLTEQTPTPSQPILPTHTQSGPTQTPVPPPTPTQTPPPLPETVNLVGAVHEYQQLNNCGPATLSTALSYWGWQGDQRDTRAYLRPNYQQVDDKNVSPTEMVAFVESETALNALTRVGGDIELLKRFIAAGFPVVIERGLQQHPSDWMGHYVLLTGYDDARARFISQDSLIMADLPVPYEQIDGSWWRDFNYTYLVVYPPERAVEMLSILGVQAEQSYNFQFAAKKALTETSSLNGRDLFFAWYNLGTNLTHLQDYAGAAEAFDLAFGTYQTIPEENRPWRNLWYQPGPYEAYYHTGRYQDIIRLGNQTLDIVGPILEETYYWLGMAREAEGDLDKAIYDYQKAYEINPISTPARQELQRLGIEVP